MEHLNTGYFALGFVGILFFMLQFWWLRMTIKNGQNESLIASNKEIEEAKQRFEEIFKL